MSKPHTESEPSDRKILLSALGWIGVIFCFFLVVAVAYLPNRAVDNEEKLAEERLQIRNQVRGEQARLVDAYEWVDQEQGIVRIPIDRAMKLAVEELRAEQQDASRGADR